MLFQLIVMALAMAGGCWLTYLFAKHGGGWVLGKIKARGLAAEAALKAKAIEAAGPIEARLSDLEARFTTLASQELQPLKSDIAMLKAKLPPVA